MRTTKLLSTLSIVLLLACSQPSGEGEVGVFNDRRALGSAGDGEPAAAPAQEADGDARPEDAPGQTSAASDNAPPAQQPAEDPQSGEGAQADAGGIQQGDLPDASAELPSGRASQEALEAAGCVPLTLEPPVDQCDGVLAGGREVTAELGAVTFVIDSQGLGVGAFEILGSTNGCTGTQTIVGISVLPGNYGQSCATTLVNEDYSPVVYRKHGVEGLLPTFAVWMCDGCPF